MNLQVEVRTADHSRKAIDKSEVETLNVDNNLLDGKEFKRFISQFPNLQDNVVRYKLYYAIFDEKIAIFFFMKI